MNERYDAWYSSNMCIVPTPQHRRRSWLGRRTNLEKQFLIILAITSFLLIFLITFMFSMYLKYGFALKFIRPLANVIEEVNKLDKDTLINKLKSSNVCLTPKCVGIASELLNGMDTSINACDDFYDMVCSNWIDKHTIPSNKGAISNFDHLNYDVSKEIKRIVENDLPNLTNNQVYRNLYNFWNICNNESRLEMEKDNELKLFIETKLGGWPISKAIQDDKDKMKLDLIDFHMKLSEQGYSIDGLFSISTVLDIFNSSKNIILITPPSVSLHHSYLIRNSTDFRVKNYFNLIKDAVKTYNPMVNVDDTEIWRLINFEKRLSLLAKNSEHNHNQNLSNLNKGKISDLFLISPEFPWNEFLKIYYQHEIPETQNILYTDKKYLEGFYEFINSTDPSVLRNYLIWRVIRSSIRLMDNRWSLIIQNFYKQNYGFPNHKNRTQFCYSLIYASFYHLIDHLYVKNKPELNKKLQVTKIAESVHSQFLNSLKEVQWFDEETRSKAINKALKIKLKIGYPEELLNRRKILNYFSELIIDANSTFYQTMLIFNRWISKSNFELLNTLNAKNDWKLFGPILTVNAFYSRFSNAVVLPTGILNRHIFSEDNPNYMNFASLGYIVGHELTHAFDQEGSKVDENGQFDWWKLKTRKQFLKKINCVVNMYSNFTFYDDKKIRGKETVNENIADINGVKQGTWCRKSRTKQLIVNAELGNHSLAKYRVIGVLSNSQEFANSFQCKLGSKMNPRKQKCTIW